VAKEVQDINSSIQVLEVATDITEKDSVDEMFKKVKSKFGTADVLVNNSGAMGELGQVREISDKTWWRDFVSVCYIHCLEEVTNLFQRKSMSKAHSSSRKASSISSALKGKLLL
jgi:NADP-dependent 3-hydroxy acid dehydrogenase YdfG